MTIRPPPEYQTGNEVRIQIGTDWQNSNIRHLPTRKQRATLLFQSAGARIIGVEPSNSNTSAIQSNISKIDNLSTMKCLTSALIRKDL